MDRVNLVEEQVSLTVNDDEIAYPDSEIEESGSIQEQEFGFFTSNGMTKLHEGSSDYEIIKKSFLSGIEGGRFLGKQASVVAIHKNVYSGISGQARMETFKLFGAAKKNMRGGDANIKYGWYGGSRKEICEIVCHGFNSCRVVNNNGSQDLYGFGVYLSPAKFSLAGAISSAVDEDGLRHVLLCRLILGKQEVVHFGSKQFHPSSKDFDSGVDNLSDPRRYIVWSTYMNSHIFPNYVISFRTLSSKGFSKIQANVMKPRSAWMRFPTLVATLERVLPHSRMSLINKYYKGYRENKVPRHQLIRKLRQVAGDKLLAEVIRIFRSQGTGSFAPPAPAIVVNPVSV